MAQQQDGRWLVVEELLERGDPAFVDEIRRIMDAEALGTFAERWYQDRRATSRRLLLAYLDRPLNAFRHEALIKRLFKRAEAAGDDQVMARFLVLFDRSVRRRLVKVRRFENRVVNNQTEARSLEALWRDQGNVVGSWTQRGGQVSVWRQWSEEAIRVPRGTVMPRGKTYEFYDHRGIKQSVADWVVRLGLLPHTYYHLDDLPESTRARLERFRLFSTPTRNYLRHRVWRYFRRLGKEQPERYVPAVAEALLHYQDGDVVDGLALLDNWSLLHILFHHSPALVSRPNGWLPASGHSLAELEPAPIYAPLWAEAPRTLFQLMVQAPARPVRRWAMGMVKRHQKSVETVVSLEEWLAHLGNDDPEVAALAADMLRDKPGLGDIPAERWLSLVATVNSSALEILVDLMRKHLSPEAVPLDQAVGLAMSRPLPLARLGVDWLRTKKPRTEAEGFSLLALVEAEAEPLRPEIVHWVRETLTEALGFQLAWILEYLDSRHEDVRAEGWRWFQDEPKARDDVDLWRKLLESPYHDIQLSLITALENRVRGRSIESLEPLALDPEPIRLLWASVLLNIHRGNRAKPVAVRQLLRRLGKRPDELPLLLPLLAVALRSTRGPEWRAGLAALVQLVEKNHEAASLVRGAFPELQWA